LDKNNANFSIDELICGLENLWIEKGNMKIRDVACGKYHSLFLSENGEVYGIGINRFGQLGQSNLTLFNSGDLIKIEFPDKNTKIIDIKCGDNHNLFLSDKGELFVNGDNTNGQLDGNLDGFLYYECTPKKLIFFDKANSNDNNNININNNNITTEKKDDNDNYNDNSHNIEISNTKKIKKIYAKHNRSAVLFEDGTAKFWGGFCYSPDYSMSKFPQFNGNFIILLFFIYFYFKNLYFLGFNNYNDEEGIPKDLKIKDLGLGYLHDLVLMEEK
jgi:alpha-tubulin suppressor-like RCC1 family protein